MSAGSILLLLLICLLGVASYSSADSLQERCSNDFTQLTECLEFSTGKSNSPSEKCCSSTSDIRGKDPVCLCFIIQQAYNGTSSLRSLGVQFSRLVQLPAACKLANSSISDCPKLLNLSPNSTDYAIFNGSATSNTTSYTAKSDGFVNQVHSIGSLAATVASVIFLSVFSIGV